MLVDIGFLLREHLARSRRFFAEPTAENHGHVLDAADVERIFGHEEVSQGVYYVGGPNMPNFLSDVLHVEGRYTGGWCGHRSYGTADSVAEILAHARPADLDQACVLFIARTSEIHRKSGPWIGPRDADGRPAPSEVVLDWELVPIDADKLERARAERDEAAPSLSP